jgi:hypothetical protein
LGPETPEGHLPMMAKESHPPDAPVPVATGSDRGTASDQPVTTLRGATVDVDIRRTGRVLVAVGLIAVAVIGVILLIAGVRSNHQADALRQRGVPVTVTVTRCLELMGGTGAQGAGYSCTGTYALDGRPYRQTIPGLSFHAVGSTVAGVADPGDPKLLSTPGQLAHQHSSWRVFILPGILLLLVVVVTAFLFLRRSKAAVPGGMDAGDAR